MRREEEEEDREAIEIVKKNERKAEREEAIREK